MTVTKYVVLSPFSGFSKGVLLDHLPDQFWLDKGYLAKIEMDESEVVEEHKVVHGRPKVPPTTHSARPSHAEHEEH